MNYTSKAFLPVSATVSFLLTCSFSLSDAADVFDWEQNAGNYPIASYQHDPVEYNQRIYIFGGWNGNRFTNSYSAPINSNGSLGTWTPVRALPQADQGPGVAVYNGWIYIALEDGKVFRSEIQADGSLGAWIEEETAAAYHGGRLSCRAYNGYLYIFGGFHFVTFDDVYVAKINADGSLDPWVATTAMPQTRQHQSVHFYNNRVYIAGGVSGSTTILRSVYSAPVNSDGTLGQWDPEADLPSTLWQHNSVLIGNHIYLFGGLTGYTSGKVSAIYQGTIVPLTGGITNWVNVGSMPDTSFVVAPGAVYDTTRGRTYLIGGYDLSQFSAKVWVSSALFPVPGDKVLVGNLNPELPTIVLTHGMQPKADFTEAQSKLWTGAGEKQAAGLIATALGSESNQVNIVEYIWEGGFSVTRVPDGDEYLDAQRHVSDAASRLAQQLLVGLGSDYDKPIHFIGHSLGTAVNGHAASAFLNAARNVKLAQFTALDRPHHIADILGIEPEEEADHNYNSEWLAAVLPVGRSDLALRIDNYFSLDGPFEAGVGDVANGPVYNHLLQEGGLVNPNDVGGAFFPDEDKFGFDNNHTGVHQWYRWTIAPSKPFPGTNSVCNGAIFARPPLGFDPSLNPCQVGWSWSLFSKTPQPFPPNNGAPRQFPQTEPLAITETEPLGCKVQVNGGITVVTCEEHSSPSVKLKVMVPEDAQFLTFRYRFTNIGDGDYAVVLVDGIPAWMLAGTSALQEGAIADSGPLPFGGLTGPREITITLFGVGEANAGFEIRDFAIIPSDADGDGISDSQDACPSTVGGEAVNRNGCSISQLVPCSGPVTGGKWKNHGQYVSAVSKKAEEFLAAGLITEAQKDAIVSAAGKSNCGKK